MVHTDRTRVHKGTNLNQPRPKATPGTTIPRRTFRTSREDDGRPLKDFLSRRCPEVPAAFLKKLLRKGFVNVSGTRADCRTRLRRGQHVSLSLPKGAFLVAPNPDVPFEIVHEDAHLVVVNKPAGVVTEPGIGHKLDSLLNGLISRYGERLDSMGPRHDFGMVHRLDRATSGLLVVAKDAATQRTLAEQFRKRRVKKTYVALVLGQLPEPTGEVRLDLGRTRTRGRARAVTHGPSARRAVTVYRTLERFHEATLVEVMPRTGRWRQVRVHFKAIGHPVAGDAEEGDTDANARLESLYGLRRMFLHAAHLEFRHPQDGRKMAFHCPLPSALKSVVEALRTRGLT